MCNDISAERSVDERQKKKLIHIVYTLLWCTGAAVITTGTYLNIDTVTMSIILNWSVFHSINFLVVLSGSLIMMFSIIGCCDFNRRDIISLFSSILFVVFFLQSLVASVSSTSRNAVEYYASRELVEFVRNGYNSSSGKAKFIALENIQASFNCCGANNWSDWRTSNWVTVPSLPFSCCNGTIKVNDCNLNNLQNVHSIGCLNVVVAKYKKNFLIMVVVSVAVSLLQIAFFETIKSHV